MGAFYRWLYAKRRNFLVATAVVYAVPMYALVLALKDDSSWIVDLVFIVSTAVGSLVFALGMWFAFGKNVGQKGDRRRISS